LTNSLVGACSVKERERTHYEQRRCTGRMETVAHRRLRLDSHLVHPLHLIRRTGESAELPPPNRLPLVLFQATRHGHFLIFNVLSLMRECNMAATHRLDRDKPPIVCANRGRERAHHVSRASAKMIGGVS
jgi:hypothetical protein